MKLIFAILLLTFATAAIPQDKSPNETPIAVIGLAQGDHWMGAIVVTQDGIIHGSNEITKEQAMAIAATLPKGHSTLVTAPACQHGIQT